MLLRRRSALSVLGAAAAANAFFTKVIDIFPLTIPHNDISIITIITATITSIITYYCNAIEVRMSDRSYMRGEVRDFPAVLELVGYAHVFSKAPVRAAVSSRGREAVEVLA